MIRYYPGALVDTRGPTELDYGARLESRMRELWSKDKRPVFSLEVANWHNRPKRKR